MRECEHMDFCRRRCTSLPRLPVHAEPLAERIEACSQEGLQPSSIAVVCHRAPAGISVARARCRGYRRRIVIGTEMAAPEMARDAIDSVRTLYVVQKYARDVSLEKHLKLRRRRLAPMLAGLIDKVLAWKRPLLHPSI